MIEVLGQSPLNSAATAGRSAFMSIFRNKVSNAFGEDPNRYPRAYTSVRGIMINKEFLQSKTPDLLQGYYFQFNPQTVDDVKNTLYEVRSYAGLAYNDYIWSGGGERIISFSLFLDNTPQSKQVSFRPTSYGSKRANELKLEGTGFTYDEQGRVISSGMTFGNAFVEDLKSSINTLKESVVPSKGPSSFEYVGDAFSNSRVDERGILPEVEKIQSFLYPAPLTGETTPLFAEGGIVTSSQFRPPATVVLALGPLYLEGVVKNAPVQYTLFDQDLTPLRATVEIEFAVFEFENLQRQIDWKPIR